MKVALISDIHANLPALEVVLAHAREAGVDAIWNMGDSVGYGPFPDEVVRLLRKEEIRSILGDFDHKVLRFKKRKDKLRKTEVREKYLAYQWAYDNLSKKSNKYLRFLSKEMRIKVKGRRVLLTHVSPGGGKKPVEIEGPEGVLQALAQEAKADVIVLGHTHQSALRKVSGAWYINPGSVGRQSDGDPRASYARLDITSDDLHVTHFRLEYDIDSVVAALRKEGLPKAFAQMFSQGRDLETVLKG